MTLNIIMMLQCETKNREANLNGAGTIDFEDLEVKSLSIFNLWLTVVRQKCCLCIINCF